MAIYSGFTMIYPLKIVIFHSYVSLPEGNVKPFMDNSLSGFPDKEWVIFTLVPFSDPKRCCLVI